MSPTCLLNREKTESTGQSSIPHLLAAALLTPVPKEKTLLKEKFQYKKDIFTQEEPQKKFLRHTDPFLSYRSPTETTLGKSRSFIYVGKSQICTSPLLFVRPLLFKSIFKKKKKKSHTTKRHFHKLYLELHQLNRSSGRENVSIAIKK